MIDTNDERFPRRLDVRHTVMQMSKIDFCLFVCLGFYAVSIVFQLFNRTVHKSMFPGQFFNQDLTSPGRPVVVLLP